MQVSNIMLSKNVLCEICREFAVKELCAYSSNSVNVIKLSDHLFNLFNLCLIMYVFSPTTYVVK